VDDLILTELGAGEADELGAGGDAEFHEHVSEVVGDGTRTDEELCRDFLVCRTLGDAPYDLQLLRRELVESTRIPLPGRLPGRTELGPCAFFPGRGSEPLKDVERALQVSTRLGAAPVPRCACAASGQTEWHGAVSDTDYQAGLPSE
jgi:hypothetical protein